jgi:hypothetical protein
MVKSTNSQVVGRFNSTRSPDIVWTVKENLDLPDGDERRVWCNCPSWKFSRKRLGRYECKHTRHVMERESNGESLSDQAHKSTKAFYGTAMGIAKIGKKRTPLPSAKLRLAEACEAAHVQLSDAAFRALLRQLRPYLLNQVTEKTTAQKAWATRHANANSDDVIRVITLD